MEEEELYPNDFGTGATHRKNTADSNGVSLELSEITPTKTVSLELPGITPRTTDCHVRAEFATRITAKKNEYHNEFVTGITPWKKAADSNGISMELAGNIPKKNDTKNAVIHFDQTVTDVTVEEGIPWETSRIDILKRLHIQDQVLRYLKNRKSAQNPAGMQCISPITAIQPTLSVTINISLKNVMISPDNFPEKSFCLQLTIICSENICKTNYQYTTRVQRRTYFYTAFPHSTYLF